MPMSTTAAANGYFDSQLISISETIKQLNGLWIAQLLSGSYLATSF